MFECVCHSTDRETMNFETNHICSLAILAYVEREQIASKSPNELNRDREIVLYPENEDVRDRDLGRFVEVFFFRCYQPGIRPDFVELGL